MNWADLTAPTEKAVIYSLKVFSPDFRQNFAVAKNNIYLYNNLSK